MPESDLTRRQALVVGAAATAGLAATAGWTAPEAGAARHRHHRPRRPRRTPRPAAPPQAPLGSGGTPMTPAQVAALAKEVGNGEPVALVDLAAVDQNCQVLLEWSRANRIAWRPAYKTLEAPELLAYVVSKLDAPRVLIHHLRTLPQALPHLPAGTDFLMGYPPTTGELLTYLRQPPSVPGKPYTLRINVDSSTCSTS